MKPIHVSLRTNDREVFYQPCVIEKMVELSEHDFSVFCRGLHEDQTFIHEIRDQLCKDAKGINHALLVLCEGRDDGVVVKSEGYDYARYSSYLSNARQMVQMGQYPSLATFNRKMVSLVEQYTKKCVACQLDGQHIIHMKALRDSVDGTPFDEALFRDMLSQRPEVGLVECCEDDLYVFIAPEHLRQEDDSQLRKLTAKELDIICAKHTLWLHDAGGERANFDGCLLQDLNLAGKDLDLALFNGAKVVNCTFSNAQMNHASCRGTRFHNCIMTDMAAEESCFREASFRSVELDRSLLTGCNFTKATFSDSSVVGCLMGCSCLDGTDFGDVDTCYADLEECSYVEEAWLGESHVLGISFEE